uniref:AlNc14C149G7461 protein n=1 Tax=Albugo laibachii Nc14 TaxID=890382 RepID=F0WLU8_9STRA|nr:AlNc14C149G7461 [Albugo laibachii Nc14]|eukprot:CCA22274.1 AlNc14C149G7461 [Albugo laibachii Nc14]
MGMKHLACILLSLLCPGQSIDLYKTIYSTPALDALYEVHYQEVKFLSPSRRSAIFDLYATIEATSSRHTLAYQIRERKFAFKGEDVQVVFGFSGKVVFEDDDPDSRCIPSEVRIEYRVEIYENYQHLRGDLTRVRDITAKRRVKFQTIVKVIEEAYEMHSQDPIHTEGFQMPVTLWTNIVDKQMPDIKQCRKLQANLPNRLLHGMRPGERKDLRENAVKARSRLDEDTYTYHAKDIHTLESENMKSSHDIDIVMNDERDFYRLEQDKIRIAVATNDITKPLETYREICGPLEPLT